MQTHVVFRCLTIGAVSGLRSMTGPAVARWRAGDPARLAFAGLAFGELIADKLPMTPARTIPPALVFRALAGGFAGRSVARSFGADLTSGMVGGAAAAVVAAYTGMWARRQIGRITALPDWVVAVGEDSLAASAAVWATRPA